MSIFKKKAVFLSSLLTVSPLIVLSYGLLYIDSSKAKIIENLNIYYFLVLSIPTAIMYSIIAIISFPLLGYSGFKNKYFILIFLTALFYIWNIYNDAYISFSIFDVIAAICNFISVYLFVKVSIKLNSKFKTKQKTPALNSLL